MSSAHALMLRWSIGDSFFSAKKTWRGVMSSRASLGRHPEALHPLHFGNSLVRNFQKVPFTWIPPFLPALRIPQVLISFW